MSATDRTTERAQHMLQNGGRVARSDSSDQGRGYKGDSSHSFRVVSGQTPAAQYKPPVVPVVNKPDLSHLGLDGLPISQPKSPMRASGRGQSPTARMHARVQSGEASPSPSAAYNGARGGMPSGDRPSSQEAVPNWAALGQFAPPVAPVNKPDLSHLGLDGLPISQPKSPMRASRGNQAPTARMHARVQSGDVSPRHPSPCNGTRGGMPSGDRSRSHPQRASSRSRSAAQSTQQQHAMRAASPDINPPRSGSRQHQQCHQQQQQYGMQAVADASPRYSNRSVQALLSPHASSQREGWFTPEGSPRLSSRNNRVSSQNQSYVPDVAPGSASSNPYYPSKMEATVFSDPRAPVLEVDSFAPGESAGLNSFGRPRGLDDPVTPRGRFR